MTLIPFLRIFLLYFPDAVIIIYLIYHTTGNKILIDINNYVFYIVVVVFILKNIIILLGYKFFYINKINNIRNAFSEYRKGKFTYPLKQYYYSDELTLLSRDMSVIGKYIDNTISTLEYEIKSLRELYNNIVFSITSYLIILNKKKEIIFANDIFCKKFQQDLDELTGKTIEDVFLFAAQNLKDSIEKINDTEKSVILEKIHLLSKNWTSVIADIKISRISTQNEEQIVLIIDDITSKCRKDYQINLISQVTETIQKDDEINRILYTILYGITSGAGLGFNRAMLFLLDQKQKYLAGETSVGPDSMEEAIEIWNSMPPGGIDTTELLNTFNSAERKGRKLLEKVVNAKFDLESDNVFVRAFKNQENIHIHNSWSDNSVDDYIRNFMDVAEFVVVPLVVENRAIGIIVADNKFNQVPIGKEHIELLSIFAVQASLLIDSYHNVLNLKKEMDKITYKQEAMIESEKLAAIGRISSHVAHEIRNPLVTMGGYARRIKKMAEGNEKIQSAADVILKESLRLENTLSNVMDLTKPPTLIKNLNNVNDIINGTIDLLKNVFFEKKIHCITNLSENLPLVNSDSNQIKQVILNLLQNSIDATPAGGEVEVITEIDNENNNVVVTIRDTGSGIENNKFDDIFEPFFTTKVTGVGLGLAIVYRIIKDHDGEILVRNREPQGAEFKIKLLFSR